MTDVEQLLRERLRAAPPSFEPVSMHAISDQVDRRRRTVRGAAMLAAALLSGAAIITPLALTGGRGTLNGAADSGTSAGGMAAPASPSVTAANPAAGTGTARSGGTWRCPPPYPQYVAIDYVDFVRLNGHEYVAGQQGAPATVPGSALDRPLGTVRCQLSAIVPDPSYHPVDGDAGYLLPGTVLYAIKGVSPSVRIAALVDNAYRVYQVYPKR
jgi:hypothetical protein